MPSKNSAYQPTDFKAITSNTYLDVSSHTFIASLLYHANLFRYFRICYYSPQKVEIYMNLVGFHYHRLRFSNSAVRK